MSKIDFDGDFKGLDLEEGQEIAYINFTGSLSSIVYINDLFDEERDWNMIYNFTKETVELETDLNLALFGWDDDESIIDEWDPKQLPDDHVYDDTTKKCRITLEPDQVFKGFPGAESVLSYHCREDYILDFLHFVDKEQEARFHIARTMADVIIWDKETYKKYIKNTDMTDFREL